MFSKNTFVCARLVFMGGVTKHRTGRTAAGAVFRNIVHGRYGIIIGTSAFYSRQYFIQYWVVLLIDKDQ